MPIYLKKNPATQISSQSDFETTAP